VPQSQDRKPNIKYPCPWGFKVIGPEENRVRAAVQACLDSCLDRSAGEERAFNLEFSRSSGQGKYVSLTLSLRIQSERERDSLFRALAARPEIVMVI